jgi:hypothetical protein
MIERLANLWEEPCDARCITTNGFIKNNGKLVMGAGTAGQAQSRYPRFPKLAGDAVKQHGNHVFPFSIGELWSYGDPDDHCLYYITFPVKSVWYEKAELELIERSAHELMSVINKLELKKVLLPLPGCGNGQLSWTDVRPVLEPILDDRVHVISNSLSKDFNPVTPISTT